jgi:hypothetical protein
MAGSSTWRAANAANGSVPDPSNDQLLYVAGPYPNASIASGIAKSLDRREYARSGGLYVGFATFRSALSGELHTVSGCLAHGGPKRTLHF